MEQQQRRGANSGDVNLSRHAADHVWKAALRLAERALAREQPPSDSLTLSPDRGATENDSPALSVKRSPPRTVVYRTRFVPPTAFFFCCCRQPTLDLHTGTRTPHPHDCHCGWMKFLRSSVKVTQGDSAAHWQRPEQVRVQFPPSCWVKHVGILSPWKSHTIFWDAKCLFCSFWVAL